jgi:hypothetical protein
MEPTVRLAMLCDYALKSQDGKLSVLGIRNDLDVQEIPGVTQAFFVVVRLALAPGTHNVRFRVVDPAGQSAIPESDDLPVEVEAPGIDTDIMLQMNTMPVGRPGIYQIQFFIEGRLIHSIPVSIQGPMPGSMAPARAN